MDTFEETRRKRLSDQDDIFKKSKKIIRLPQKEQKVREQRLYQHELKKLKK